MKKKWYLVMLLLGLWAGSCAAVGFAVRSRMIRQLHFTEVPVACHTLQRRTPITEDDLCLRTLPASALSDSVVTDPQLILGRWTDLQGRIPAGSPFYQEMLSSLTQMPDRSVPALNPGQAVFPLSVDIRDTGGNAMQPGQNVDLYVYGQDAQRHDLMDCLFRNVRILEIQNRSGQPMTADSQDVPSLILLAVDQTYIPVLSLAEKKGTIELYLTSESYSLQECTLNRESTVLSWLAPQLVPSS